MNAGRSLAGSAPIEALDAVVTWREHG